jgi:hypothetical protein
MNPWAPIESTIKLHLRFQSLHMGKGREAVGDWRFEAWSERKSLPPNPITLPFPAREIWVILIHKSCCAHTELSFYSSSNLLSWAEDVELSCGREFRGLTNDSDFWRTERQVDGQGEERPNSEQESDCDVRCDSKVQSEVCRIRKEE